MPKTKKCRCGNEYTQYTTMQNCCIECLAEKVAKNRIKSEKSAKVAQKRELIKAKEAIKTRREWIKTVQEDYFNPYIRARDAADPCISCGRHDHEIEVTYGGKWDCGHYLSVGSHPELRFEPLNAHKQCKKCNGGSGKYAKKDRTVSETYLINLIAKIGLEQVDWLKGPHDPKKYTIPELKELKELYKQKLKEIKNE